MDSVKKFFQQKKVDMKFKMAGEGHRLDEERRRPPSHARPGKRINNRKQYYMYIMVRRFNWEMPLQYCIIYGNTYMYTSINKFNLSSTYEYWNYETT